MTPAQVRVFDLIWPTMMHVPYVWGGANPTEGLDCSGLVIEILKSLEVLQHNYDTTAQGLWNKFPEQVMEPEIGDLVFFGVNEATITHIGIMVNSELMLEAGGGNRSTTSKAIAVSQNARVRVRPVSSRLALVGYKRPEYRF